MVKFLPHWKHKNIVLLLLGILMAFVFSRSEIFKSFLFNLGNFGYLSAFIAGVLFVSTFTVAAGALILLTLTKVLPPFWLISIAVLGASFGDLVIFRFVRKSVIGEIMPIYNQIKGNHLKKIFHTKYFGWTLPVVGALIIASPFPDELGISLIGLSAVETRKFLLISLLSHTVGMFFLVSVSLAI